MGRLRCVLVLFCLLAGCDKQAAPEAKAKDAAPPAAKAEKKKAAPLAAEAAAIEIAKKAVAANDPAWADKAVYEAKRDAEGGGWWVTVWRIAAYDKDGKPLFTPGGHRGVRIDKDGNVAAYMRGE